MTCYNGGYAYLHNPQSHPPGLCRPHFPAVAKTFIAPGVDLPLNIKVTDTSMFYPGQGVRIGSGFYQITDITSAQQIVIQHSGLGITPGVRVEAQEPVSGCYQFPVIPVGKVMLNYDPSVFGFDVNGVPVVGSFVLPNEGGGKIQARFGYSGPETVDLDIVFIGTTANAPTYIGVELPVTRRALEHFTDGATVYDGGAPAAFSGIAKFGTGQYSNYLLLGKSGEAPFGNGTLRGFKVQGSYQVDIG